MRNQLTRALLVLMLLCVCSPELCAASPWRDGDIIFHTSRSSQSVAIQRATHSPWSHMGVIIHRDGKPCVFEAIATVRSRGDVRGKNPRDDREKMNPAAMGGDEQTQTTGLQVAMT